MNVRRTAVAFVCTFAGIALLTGNALASESQHLETSGPKLTLAMVDTDLVAVSGRNFPANDSIPVLSKSSNATGNATATTTSEGRFMLAFLIPKGSTGKITVSTESPVAEATIDPEEVVSTPPTTVAPPVTLTDKVAGLPGASDFNERLAEYRRLKAQADANTQVLEQLVTAASPSNASDIESALKQSQDALTNAMQYTESSVATINAAADTATSQDQINDLAPAVKTLSAALDEQIITVKALILVQEASIQKLTDTLNTPTTSTTFLSTSTTTSTTSTTLLPSTTSTTAAPSIGSEVPVIQLDTI